MDVDPPGPPSAFQAFADALERCRPELERMAQEAIAASLAERGRDPALARLIAGPPAPPDPPTPPAS